MFFVIEGIDGAGCETQVKSVFNVLRTTYNLPTSFIKFPHYDTPVGKMIQDFLYLNQKMTAEEQFLLYTLQFIFDAKTIREVIGDAVLGNTDKRKTQKALPERKQTLAGSTTSQAILIADRYFTTTLCYQTLEGIDESFALLYAEKFKIVKPDLVFFLDVKPETAIAWKFGENKEKNFREKDHVFIKKTYQKYHDLVARQVWTKWIRVNGEQPKEKVTQDILKHLL